MTYKGKYKPDPRKYSGDPSNVIFRSLWERQVFRWLDENPNVVQWSSEEVVIPYRCPMTGRSRRYFVDIYVKWSNNSVTIAEVKPKKQTKEPTVPKRKTKRYLEECMTYVTNQAKWVAAENYAKNYGWTFAIWHEDVLKSMGIKLLT